MPERTPDDALVRKAAVMCNRAYSGALPVFLDPPYRLTDTVAFRDGGVDL